MVILPTRGAQQESRGTNEDIRRPFQAPGGICGKMEVSTAGGAAEEIPMRAYEFPIKVKPDGELETPDELRKLLSPQPAGRLIVLINEPGEDPDDSAWSRLAAEQFLAGYAEADSAYDWI